MPIWSVAQRRVVQELEGHEERVACVAFSVDGILATGSADNTVRLWDVDSGQQIAILGEHDMTVHAVSFSPDGMTLASCAGDGTIKLWDVATHSAGATLEGHTNSVVSIAFSADGKTLASASWDGTVKLWDLQTRVEFATLKGHSGHVSHLAFFPNGRTLASTGTDGTVRLWDFPLLIEQDTPVGHYPTCYSRGSLLARWTADGLPRVCDTSAGEALRKVIRPDTVCVVDSATGKSLAMANIDGTVEIHHLDSGDRRELVDGHDGGVDELTFSPDGNSLASVGGPGLQNELKLWNVVTGSEIFSTDVFWNFSPVFSPDSHRLATVNEDRPDRVYSIRLWDVSGKQLAKIIGERTSSRFFHWPFPTTAGS